MTDIDFFNYFLMIIFFYAILMNLLCFVLLANI